ncbi:copper-binding protein [Bradyrhizobium guangxiense]
MKTVRHTLAAAAFAVAALIAAPAMAESANATGQVTKVDDEAGKVTIKHGPIKALDMPDPMTMVYRVKDPALLKSLKAGDNVKFDIDHDTSGYVVTRIEKK